MNIFDKFFDKIKGAYFAFLTLLAVGLGIIIALLIYLPVDPSYSILSNYISDLGAGPFGSRVAFGVGMIIGAISLIFLILYISRYLKKKEERSQLIWGFQNTGLIAAVGLVLIGIFPLDRADDFASSTHFLATLIYFGFTAISNIYLGYIEYKNSEFSKIMAIVTFLAGIFSAIFVFGFVIQEFELIPPQAFVFLSEWTFFIFITLWLITHGIYFWKKRE